MMNNSVWTLFWVPVVANDRKLAVLLKFMAEKKYLN